MYSLSERLLQLLFETGEGGGGGTGTQDPPPAADPPKDPPEGDPPKDEPGGKKKDDEFPWDEHNRLKREAAERAKKERDEEAKRRREAGEHEKVATEATERADKAEAELERVKRERRAETVAERVGFIYADDIGRYLTVEQMESEQSIESALKDLKKEKPRYFEDKQRSGGEIEEEERREPAPRTGGESEPFGFERLRGVKRKST